MKNTEERFEKLVCGTWNKQYTFDTFIVRQENQLSHAASMSATESPGRCYNPLFFYGPVGSGKTHLLHAIGNKIHQDYPDKNIVYSCLRYDNDALMCLIRDDEMRGVNFLRDIDVLLVDDVHAVRQWMEEILFHVFNELYSNDKQLIFASEVSPKGIVGLQEPLASRFQWGLTTDIHPIDRGERPSAPGPWWYENRDGETKVVEVCVRNRVYCVFEPGVQGFSRINRFEQFNSLLRWIGPAYPPTDIDRFSCGGDGVMRPNSCGEWVEYEQIWRHDKR